MGMQIWAIIAWFVSVTLLFEKVCGFQASNRQLTSLKSFHLKDDKMKSLHQLRGGSHTLPDWETSNVLTEEVHRRAQRFMHFLDSSPEPFHVVQNVLQRLHEKGFILLKEDEIWSEALQPGGKYVFIRGGSSLVAFTIGKDFHPETSIVKILGAHTDSPHLKIKPKSKRSIQSGLVQLNVECYGGGLWHTWFDRDLSIAGRVILRTKAEDPSKDQFFTKLVHIPQSILRIPNLCIHLRTPEEREAFKFNKEDHLPPILCGEVKRRLQSTTSAESASNNNDGKTDDDTKDTWKNSHETLLLQFLATSLNIPVDDIMDFELSVYDTQPAQRSGLQSEFVCSARIDNLASCFVLTEAFIDEHSGPDSAPDKDIDILALFDHEEVGSDSVVGAGSTLIHDSIARILNTLLVNKLSGGVQAEKSFAKDVPYGMLEEWKRIITRKSFILSVDMAHAVHPNYAAKHDKQHAPYMNHGLVIKSNVNQRYATNGITGFLVRELGRKARVPVQEFAVRNDCPCGSTIGPTLSTNTGIRAVDVGMPQLSMHSIREMMGVVDLTHGYRLFRQFLREFRHLDQTLDE